MGDKVAVVIEDDADVRDLLRTILTQSGFDTITAANGLDGIAAVRAHKPILTTLDVSMPGMDGFAVAAQLREFSDTYIVMLTGQTDEIDIIQGLQSGADDYLLKPFRPRELRVRIEAMLRRPRNRVKDAPPVVAAPAQAAVAGEPVAEPVRAEELVPEPVVAPVAAVVNADGPLGFDGLDVDVDTRVVLVDGVNVDLTPSEFDLLVTLLGSGRRVRSKADLVLALRGESFVTTYYVTDADKRAVEVHIANLRRKIGDSSTTPRWIETVRGVGYRLAR